MPNKGHYFKVLALTFTNKAAAEMRGRVEDIIPNGLSRVRLTTFDQKCSFFSIHLDPT